MRKLTMFNTVSLDGYFTDANNDMSWAHKNDDDAEWNAFVSDNAKGGGALVFGRVTYEQMVSFWPTPQAKQLMPAVAERMNAMQKLVFSRTLKQASWQNTTLCKGDLASEMRRLKETGKPEEGLTILGSGSLVAQLAPLGLIDEYTFVIAPIVLGAGRTLFQGEEKKDKKLSFRQTSTRTFRNGNLVVSYQPVK